MKQGGKQCPSMNPPSANPLYLKGLTNGCIVYIYIVLLKLTKHRDVSRSIYQISLEIPHQNKPNSILWVKQIPLMHIKKEPNT